MPLYGQYIAEREGAELIYNEHGFITFRFFVQNGRKNCLIQDFFVDSDHRNKGVGKTLFEMVRKLCLVNEVVAILCWVDFGARNWQTSLGIIISHGFRPVFCNGSTMQLCHELTIQPAHTEEMTNGKHH